MAMTMTVTVFRTTFDLKKFSCIRVVGFCVVCIECACFLPIFPFSFSLLMLSFEQPQYQVKLHRNYALTGLYSVLKCSFVFHTFYQHQHHSHWISAGKPLFSPSCAIHFYFIFLFKLLQNIFYFTRVFHSRSHRDNLLGVR